MFEIIIGFVIGLIVGWNFLPQPEPVKAAIDNVVATVKGWFGN
jgi:hypothetical protein